MREAQGLGARQLARLAKVSDGYLTAVEAGRAKPTRRWLAKVEAALVDNMRARS